MNWLLVALLNPILHAGVNHFDKYLISKYLRNVQAGALVIFSALFSVIFFPIVLWQGSNFFDVSLWQGLILTLNGTLIVLAVMVYLFALREDEASFVVPLFQFIPILALILGFLFLGETIPFPKIIGALIILCGAAILSLDIKGSQWKFKKKVLLLMILSCFFYASNIVIFKSIAVDIGFWQSMFWDLLGKVLFAIFLLLFVPSFRKSFLAVWKEYGMKFVLLNGANDVLSVSGDWALAFAALSAPVFFVYLVSAVQPLFVFIFGLILTIFFPSIGREILEKKLLWQKLCGIILVIAGALVLGL